MNGQEIENRDVWTRLNKFFFFSDKIILYLNYNYKNNIACNIKYDSIVFHSITLINVFIYL